MSIRSVSQVVVVISGFDLVPLPASRISHPFIEVMHIGYLAR